MGNSVCGVVIAYYPSASIVGNVRLLCEQVGHVVVVDNTPQADASTLFTELEYLDACTVIRNGINLGIATALNIGIRHAISQGFAWIITFDQDSQVQDGYVEAMLSTFDDAAKYCEAAIVCPRYQDARIGCFLPTHRTANGDVVACITSGAMVSAETFESFGKMEEDLFIDYVDLEFCLRIRAAGLKIVECSNAILVHSLGRMTQHKFLWKTFSTTNHSAKRRYYITRNRLVLIKRYFDKDREWAFGDFKGIVLETIKMLLVEQDRLSKFRYMARAVYDAIFDKLGQRIPL